MALARAGLDRFGKSATVTTVIAANLPDLDIVVHPLFGKTGYLCYHRGITHALLGLGVESLLLATLVWFLVRQWHPDTRWWPLWLSAGLGLLSHVGLDSLNTYGVRPFLPFSGAWYYGDAAFIVEPWIWLGFGAGACAGAPEKLTRKTRNGWLLWTSMVFAVLLYAGPIKGRLPAWAFAVWVLVMAGALIARQRGLSPRVRQRVALAGIALALLYPLGVVRPLNRSAGVEARDLVRTVGQEPVVSSTVHPSPARPWRQRAVVSTESTIYLVEVNLLQGTTEVTKSLARNLSHPALEWLAGEESPEYEAWKGFAREPYVAPVGSGSLVLGDARYRPEPVEAWCNFKVDVPGE